jgi:hypothetical protein
MTSPLPYDVTTLKARGTGHSMANAVYSARFCLQWLVAKEGGAGAMLCTWLAFGDGMFHSRRALSLSIARVEDRLCV